MKPLTIYPLPLIKIRGPKCVLTHLAHAAEMMDTYTGIWYIEGAEENILVDAGGTAETMQKRGYAAEHIASPVESLNKLGLRPSDIDIVICTHLHNDHMELGQLYTRAAFIIQKAELEANEKPHPIEAPRCVPQHLLKGLSFDVITGDKEITDGVGVMFTPGHTRGGQSVLVRTSLGTAAITGLCTINDNFQPKEPFVKTMPVIPPGIHLDVREAFDSMMKIKERADMIIPLHEPTFALKSSIP